MGRTEGVEQSIRDNRKVDAIKKVRMITGWSLRKTKYEVELVGYEFGVWNKPVEPVRKFE